MASNLPQDSQQPSSSSRPYGLSISDLVSSDTSPPQVSGSTSPPALPDPRQPTSPPGDNTIAVESTVSSSILASGEGECAAPSKKQTGSSTPPFQPSHLPPPPEYCGATPQEFVYLWRDRETIDRFGRPTVSENGRPSHYLSHRAGGRAIARDPGRPRRIQNYISQRDMNPDDKYNMFVRRPTSLENLRNFVIAPHGLGSLGRPRPQDASPDSFPPIWHPDDYLPPNSLPRPAPPPRPRARPPARTLHSTRSEGFLGVVDEKFPLGFVPGPECYKHLQERFDQNLPNPMDHGINQESIDSFFPRSRVPGWDDPPPENCLGPDQKTIVLPQFQNQIDRSNNLSRNQAPVPLEHEKPPRVILVPPSQYQSGRHIGHAGPSNAGVSPLRDDRGGGSADPIDPRSFAARSGRGGGSSGAS